jgi:hypothetical protein
VSPHCKGLVKKEERCKRSVAAEVVKKKKEKTRPNDSMLWNMGVQPLHPTLMNAERNEKKVEEQLLREKGNVEPGHSFFEISSRGPGWVTSKDEGAQSKFEPGAAGQWQDLGNLTDHASSAVGSTEDESLGLALIKLNSAARYRQDRRRAVTKERFLPVSC